MAKSADLIRRYDAFLHTRNGVAFLKTIAAAEGCGDANGYHRLVGGAPGSIGFVSLAKHPRIPVKTRYGWSDAAGRYQIMAVCPGRVTVSTWDDVSRALALTDFSEHSQDLAACWLIDRRGAIDAVLAGNFVTAVEKCRREWASLPGAGYGQSEQSIRRLRELYMAAGGLFDNLGAGVA